MLLESLFNILRCYKDFEKLGLEKMTVLVQNEDVKLPKKVEFEKNEVDENSISL